MSGLDNSVRTVADLERQIDMLGSSVVDGQIGTAMQQAQGIAATVTDVRIPRRLPPDHGSLWRLLTAQVPDQQKLVATAMSIRLQRSAAERKKTLRRETNRLRADDNLFFRDPELITSRKALRLIVQGTTATRNQNDQTEPLQLSFKDMWNLIQNQVLGKEVKLLHSSNIGRGRLPRTGDATVVKLADADDFFCLACGLRQKKELCDAIPETYTAQVTSRYVGVTDGSALFVQDLGTVDAVAADIDLNMSLPREEQCSGAVKDADAYFGIMGSDAVLCPKFSYPDIVRLLSANTDDASKAEATQLQDLIAERRTEDAISQWVGMETAPIIPTLAVALFSSEVARFRECFFPGQWLVHMAAAGVIALRDIISPPAFQAAWALSTEDRFFGGLHPMAHDQSYAHDIEKGKNDALRFPALKAIAIGFVLLRLSGDWKLSFDASALGAMDRVPFFKRLLQESEVRRGIFTTLAHGLTSSGPVVVPVKIVPMVNGSNQVGPAGPEVKKHFDKRSATLFKNFPGAPETFKTLDGETEVEHWKHVRVLERVFVRFSANRRLDLANKRSILTTDEVEKYKVSELATTESLFTSASDTIRLVRALRFMAAPSSCGFSYYPNHVSWALAFSASTGLPRAAVLFELEDDRWWLPLTTKSRDRNAHHHYAPFWAYFYYEVRFEPYHRAVRIMNQVATWAHLQDTAARGANVNTSYQARFELPT